jgi:hypothetical protein
MKKAPTYEIMKNDEEASVLLETLKNAKALLKECMELQLLNNSANKFLRFLYHIKYTACL